MKWKEERVSILARLDALESKVAALEAGSVAGGGGDDDDTDGPDDGNDSDDGNGSDDRDLELQAAWSAVMNGQAGIQIAIVNPNDPRFDGGPFVVEDNKDKKVGEGDTVAEAFEAYKSKGGKRHGDSEVLSAFEYEQAAFFCQPGNVQAPTSTRRSNQGFHCDYFRTGVTAQGGEKVGPFDAPGKAVEALRNTLGSDL